MKNKEKNRVEKALRYRLFGLGKWFRISKLFGETLIDDGEKKTCLLSEEEVMSLLERVDRSDPKKRKIDWFDLCFERLIPFLPMFPSDEPLVFISKYGYLEQTFWNVLDNDGNIGRDVFFQYRLCEVTSSRKAGLFYPKFGNLLFGYIQRYDLLPQVKDALFDNPMYARVVLCYKTARS